MIPFKPYFKFIVHLVMLYICIPEMIAQNPFSEKPISTAYYQYNSLPREIAYVHLNKSKYIKGENLGFTAYIRDKKNNLLSQKTTNLYCVITDKNETIVKSKLIKVENGIASNVFRIDSLFSSGEYQFKAYTNWMKNFNEQNYYVQTIEVIDTDINDQPKSESTNLKIDAQFLPEGGHLITGIKNTIGVIVKDDLGYGLGFMKGEVSDENDQIITTFKLNQFGISKFDFTPEIGNSYKVKFSGHGDQFPIQSPENYGINLSVNRIKNFLGVTFRTNETTHKQIKNEVYKLVLHNSIDLKSFPVRFDDKTEVINLIKQDDLFSGMNIITLFDSKNNPIVERLFFNYEGIAITNSYGISTKKENDSIVISLNYNALKSNSFNNLSISVLPSTTVSYKPHHNSISYTLLQPFLNSPVENASYYFTAINSKKIYELDLLLLTQGWSSYDWNTIFNHPPKAVYEFENGIRLKAHINTKDSYRFYFDALGESDSFITEVSSGDDIFDVESLFPYEGDNLIISDVKPDGQFKIPKLYLQFFPSNIPLLNTNKTLLISKTFSSRPSSENSIAPSFFKDYEQLDEVVLSYEKENSRMEKFKAKAYEKVDLFNENMRNLYRDFFSYIRTKGYDAFQDSFEWKIRSRVSSSLRADPIALIYLDDVILPNHDILATLDMRTVDYVTINKNGFGGGLRGAGGIIKIYTDPKKINALNSSRKHQNYSIPLSFSKPTKTFYKPIYSSYTSSFFQKYGIIDWFPECQTDKNGTVTIKILKTQLPEIKLCIEGIGSDGSFISEEKNITINNGS